nr:MULTISPECIES: DUF2235 domain-containing protein [unclassified Thioalkalivibrio]
MDNGYRFLVQYYRPGDRMCLVAGEV